jgi:hypothetical protein
MIGGIMFLWFARPLGIFTARLAGVADDAIFECRISPSAFLNIMLAAIGICVGITEFGAMIRLLILSYENPFTGGSDLYAASKLIPDASPIIAHAVVVLMAAALALRSRAIANALVGKVEDAYIQR